MLDSTKSNDMPAPSLPHNLVEMVDTNVTAIQIIYDVASKRRSKARLSHPISPEETEDKKLYFLKIWPGKNYSIRSGITGAFDRIYGYRFCSKWFSSGDRTLILSAGLYISN